jgi:hypothetical protein
VSVSNASANTISFSSDTKYYVYKFDGTDWELYLEQDTGLSSGNYEQLPVKLTNDATILATGSPYNTTTSNSVNVYTLVDSTESILNVSNTLNVYGNIKSSSYFLGDGSKLSGLNLQSISDLGNVTSNTIQLTNPTTGLVVSSNIYISNTHVFGTLESFTDATSLGILTGTAFFESLGSSVALSEDGTRMAIGSYNLYDSTVSGIVKVYDYVSGAWTQNYTIYGTSGGDKFGESVDITPDGTRIVIGAPGSNSVVVYEYVPPPDPAASPSWNTVGSALYRADGWFGHDVAINSSGDVIAVGSPNESGVNLSNNGAVRVYYLSTNPAPQNWVQRGGTLYGAYNYDKFGFSVDLVSTGDRLVVGIPQDYMSSNYGMVKIFDWNAAVTSWNQVGPDITSTATASEFGYSVAISSDGGRVAIGEPRATVNSITQCGEIYVYEYVAPPDPAASPSWNIVGLTRMTGSSQYSRLGTSIAVSSDGFTVIGGGYGPSASGEAVIYKYDALTDWVKVRSTFVAESGNGTTYGHSVAISSDSTTVALSDRQYDATALLGRVYTYALNLNHENELFIDNKTNFQGNVQASYFIGNGSLLTGVPVLQYYVQNVHDILSYYGTARTIYPLGILLTPKSSSSVIHLRWVVNCEMGENNVFRIYRDGTLIGYNINRGTNVLNGVTSAVYDVNVSSTIENVVVEFATTGHTAGQLANYEIQVYNPSTASYFYLNRTASTSTPDTTGSEVTVSLKSAIEISQ